MVEEIGLAMASTVRFQASPKEGASLQLAGIVSFTVDDVRAHSSFSVLAVVRHERVGVATSSDAFPSRSWHRFSLC